MRVLYDDTRKAGRKMPGPTKFKILQFTSVANAALLSVTLPRESPRVDVEALQCDLRTRLSSPPGAPHEDCSSAVNLVPTAEGVSPTCGAILNLNSQFKQHIILSIFRSKKRGSPQHNKLIGWRISVLKLNVHYSALKYHVERYCQAD